MAAAMTDPSPEDAAQALHAQVQDYLAEARARIPGFVARHFRLRGTLALHRRALGPDMLRAQVNLLLVIPALVQKLIVVILRRLRLRAAAERLNRRELFLETDVARELRWLVFTELLHLPIDQGHRSSKTDALAERLARDPHLRPWLERALETYSGGRVAAADMTNAALAAAVGAAQFQALSPGSLSLGPLFAGLIAQQMAVASFPLGATLGGAFYAVFPPDPPLALVGAVTVAIMLAAATLSAFAGIIADPIQAATGIHRRRLGRLLDQLERQLLGDPDAAFETRSHYVARIVDMIDAARAAATLVR